MRLPDDFEEYPSEAIMSNYDGQIILPVANLIKDKPFFSRYPGWHFNGKVWWAVYQWHCEVWQYHSYQETISADTLPEIMQQVSDKYGYE